MGRAHIRRVRKRHNPRAHALAMLAIKHNKEPKAGRCLHPMADHQSESKSGTQEEFFWEQEDDKKFCEACVQMIRKKELKQRQGSLSDENLEKLLVTFPNRTRTNLENRYGLLKHVYDKWCQLHYLSENIVEHENLKRDLIELKRKLRKYPTKKFKNLLNGPPKDLELLEEMYSPPKLCRLPLKKDHALHEKDEHMSTTPMLSPKRTGMGFEMPSDRDTIDLESPNRRSNERQDQRERGSAQANENENNYFTDLSVKTRTSLGNNSGNRDDLQRNIARQQVHLARCSQSGDFIVRNPCDVFDTSDRDEGSANAQRPAEAPSNEACSPIMAAGALSPKEVAAAVPSKVAKARVAKCSGGQQ